MPRLPLPPLTRSELVAALPVGLGLVAALAVAGFFAVLPDWRLEALVEASGLPRLLSLAQPPLGTTARVLLAVAGGALAGAVIWSALFLLVGPGGLMAPRVRGEDDVPVVRRADAHPDAPPRRPLSAAELGTPPAAPSEQPLPADLEQPLAAFDPYAIPDVPREPVRPVRSVVPPAAPAEPLAPVERIETFELPPIVRDLPRGVPAESTPSIEALLQRLERGARRSASR